jgi:hypothetical protein
MKQLRGLYAQTFFTFRTALLYWFICKVPVTVVRFLWNLDFIGRFSKNTQISNFTKMSAVEPSFYMRTEGWTDRRTDRHDEAKSRFSQFCEGA